MFETNWTYFYTSWMKLKNGWCTSCTLYRSTGLDGGRSRDNPEQVTWQCYLVQKVLHALCKLRRSRDKVILYRRYCMCAVYCAGHVTRLSCTEGTACALYTAQVTWQGYLVQKVLHARCILRRSRDKVILYRRYCRRAVYCAGHVIASLRHCLSKIKK